MGRATRRALVAALVALPLAASAPSAEASGRHHDRYVVSSPDRRIVVQFRLDDGAPLYRVFHDGAPLVADSGLGFRFEDAPALDDDLALRRVRRDRGTTRLAARVGRVPRRSASTTTS